MRQLALSRRSCLVGRRRTDRMSSDHRCRLRCCLCCCFFFLFLTLPCYIYPVDLLFLVHHWRPMTGAKQGASTAASGRSRARRERDDRRREQSKARGHRPAAGAEQGARAHDGRRRERSCMLPAAWGNARYRARDGEG
jgi:hypothetical protein